MRYFNSICAGLLVLMLIMQARILRRLDDIAERSARPGVSAGPAVSVSYIDHDEKTQERVLDVAFYPDKTPPAHLQITERHEQAAQ